MDFFAEQLCMSKNVLLGRINAQDIFFRSFQGKELRKKLNKCRYGMNFPSGSFGNSMFLQILSLYNKHMKTENKLLE